MATTISQTHKSIRFPAWLGFTGLLTILGIVAWITQLNKGIGATDLSNLNPWGIYIAGFIFFMGLSAGSLVLASLPVLFDLPKFRPYAKLAAITALVSLIIGGLFILVDIGKPERLWHIVRYAQLGSPMLWDLLLTIVYLIVSTVYLRRLTISDQPKGVLKPLALLALIAGLADGITGFVFATQVGREFWYSAVQPMAFFIAALASTGAAILLIMLVLKPFGYVKLECCDLSPIAGLTAVALVIDLLLIASEVIALAFTHSTDALLIVQSMVASPMFWVEVVTGVTAIILLLLPATRSASNWVTVAAILALIDLALKRYLFIRMGFAIPNINYAGVAIAPAHLYRPSMVEWAIVAGMIGLFFLLLSLGFRMLWITPADQE